ncbi:MAG: hypothetical protein RL398_1710 [Planctomycetota bacterium]
MIGRGATVLAALLSTSWCAAQQDLQALVDKLAGADGNQRNSAYQELMRRNGPELSAMLLKSFATMPREGRQYAVYLLQSQPIDGLRDGLRKFVKDPQPFVRAVGAALLWRGGEKEHVGVLTEAMGAARDDVDRSGMLNLVWNVDAAEVVAAVRAYVAPERQSGVVISALNRLRRAESMVSDATLAAVRTAASGKDVSVRAAALAFLVGTDDGTAASELAAILRETPTVLGQVRGLLREGVKLPGELVEAIAATLEAPRSTFEIEQTAQLLQSHAPGKAAPMLRRLLRHDNDEYRAAAADALAEIPGGLEDKDLLALLAGESIAERLTAADMLRRRDDPRGLVVVLELLPKADVRRADAARVLGGFRSKEVIPALLELLDDKDVAVRRQAWTSLQQVLRGLYPYRKFEFERSGYDPAASDRAAGIAQMKTWWQAVGAEQRGK